VPKFNQWEHIKKQAKLQMIASGDLKPHEDDRPIPDLYEAYREYNEELFGGELPDDLLVKYNFRLKKIYGRCRIKHSGKKGPKAGTRVGCSVVAIELKHGRTDRSTRKTLVHEMCHAYVAIKFGEVGHGPNFWQVMKKCGYHRGHSFANPQPRENDKWSA
tara:strand:+ start:874 stop:1353 length:480 start_codon:yes stop_codon:yes gene_type:complete